MAFHVCFVVSLQPIEFKGSRTLDGFVKFIDSQGKDAGDEGEEDMGGEEDLPSDEDLAGLEADESLDGAEDEGEDTFDDEEPNSRDEL